MVVVWEGYRLTFTAGVIEAMALIGGMPLYNTN